MTEEEIAAMPIFDPTRAGNLFELLVIIKQHCIDDELHTEIMSVLDKTMFAINDEIQGTNKEMRLDFMVGGWTDDQGNLLPACVMKISVSDEFRQVVMFGLDDDRKLILGYSLMDEQKYHQNLLPPSDRLN